MTVALNAAQPPILESPPLRRRARVLFVDHTAQMGGGEVALLNLVRHLDRDRVEPSVALLSEGPLADALRASGVDVIVVPASRLMLDQRKDELGGGSLLKLRAAIAALSAAWRIARVARRRDVDIVHTNSLKADLIGGLAGRLARRRVVWHVRDRIDEDYLPAIVVRAFRWLAACVPHFVIANSSATLATLRLPDRSVPAAMVPSGVQLPARRGRRRAGVVSDGSPVAALSDGRERPGPRSAPRFLLVGRLARWKGQHVFIDAAAIVRQRAPNATFQIVGNAMFGETDYEHEIREQAARLGLGDAVEFAGFRDDVPALMSAADVVVHASITAEPFGQVITEAMALGRPVIATRGGGVLDIVADGETGLLVTMGSVEEMADAMVALALDPARAATMGRAGYRRVCERFTIQHTAAGVASIYETLLPTNP